MKRLHADPEFAAMIAESGRKQMKRILEPLKADPDFRAAASKRMKQMRADPNFAAKQRAATQRLFDDPEYVAAHAKAASERMIRRNADPEFRAAASKRMKQWHLERKRKHSSSKNR
jgi:hypothetical protein